MIEPIEGKEHLVQKRRGHLEPYSKYADNTVERLDKYIAAKPSFLGKYFMKSNTKEDNE